MAKDPETITYPDSELRVSSKQVIFMGPHTKIIHRYPGRDMLGFQVIFQPGTVSQLTKVSSAEFMNAYLDAEDLFGKGTSLVNEQLFHSKTYQEMICIVENFLWKMIRKVKWSNHPVDAISKDMTVEKEQFSLDKFLKTAYLSHRQVDRMFLERIGMAPKRFLQLSRFDKAFRMKNRLPQKDWLSIALHCGYHDYQHLVKEYKEFTGYTPTRFFAIDNAAPERLLGDIEL